MFSELCVVSANIISKYNQITMLLDLNFRNKYLSCITWNFCLWILIFFINTDFGRILEKMIIVEKTVEKGVKYVQS